MSWLRNLFGGRKQESDVEWTIDGQPRFKDDYDDSYDYRDPPRRSRVYSDDEMDPADEILKQSGDYEKAHDHDHPHPVEEKKEEPKVEEKKEEKPRDLKKQRRVTGYDILYFIPQDMRRIKVQIQEKNGRVKNEYTLTNYLSIRPGERVRLIVK